jgi:hypothetical protein
MTNEQSPAGEVGKSDVYGEIMQCIRHYSTLRFAMLTVFLTTFGALVTAYGGALPLFGKSNPVIALAGLVLSLMFGCFEATLSYNLHTQWAAAKVLAEGVVPRAFAHREPLPLWAVRGFMGVWYAGCVVFWGIQLTSGLL